MVVAMTMRKTNQCEYILKTYNEKVCINIAIQKVYEMRYCDRF